MPTRQKRRATHQSGAGIGVDQYGGPAIDPTENVLALVDAEGRYRDSLRAIDNQRQDELREAEKYRVNCLDEVRQSFESRIAAIVTRYDTRIDAINTAATTATSSLLATQLDGIRKSLGDRITDLEKKSWEGSGKTSVLDPATAAALSKIESLVSSRDVGSGRAAGTNQSWTMIFALIAAAGTVAAIMIAILK